MFTDTVYDNILECPQWRWMEREYIDETELKLHSKSTFQSGVLIENYLFLVVFLFVFSSQNKTLVVREPYRKLRLEGSSGGNLPQTPVESRNLDEMIRGSSRLGISREFSCFSGQPVQSLLSWWRISSIHMGFRLEPYAYCFLSLGIFLKRISTISITTI